MAPTGRDKVFHPKNMEITKIYDLDSANTNSRVEYIRSPSYNIPLVVRAATSKANCTKENDDTNAIEIQEIQPKLKAEDFSDDGSPFPTYFDIQCLGGVDRDIKNSPAISGLKSCNQSPAATSRRRTWRSSGMGKKRKKSFKKRHSKRQKTTGAVFMTSNESMQTLDCMSCSDNETASADEADDVKVLTNNTNRMKKCTITAGDGKNKSGAKGGVTTQTACSAVNGNKKVYHSRAEQRRGGGAGGGGDDGDDERGKPPRKPPDHTAGSKSSKIKKKAKTPNDEEVVSEQNELEHPPQPERPCQPNQPQVRPNQPQVKPNQQVVLILNNNINHSNYCKMDSCVKCNRVKTMLAHYFDEMNGTCSCNKCQVWLCVLKYHASVCQIQDCKVCKRITNVTVKRTATATVIQQKELNVPACGPSLDQDDFIVWRDKSFPKDATHFKEDTHYIRSQDCLDKGGHGAVFDIHVNDEVKKKYFNSDTKDLVIKMCGKVGKDELYVLGETSHHPNFVDTYCVVQKADLKKHGIVMEKCELSLKDHLRNLAKKGKAMEIYECMFYWSQVLDALKYLHHLRTGIPVIHKDIKAENVLLSIKDNLVRVKLADYDTVKLLHHEFTQPGLKAKGTLGLISPEVLRQQPHGRPADVWNMGMFLLQLLFVEDFQVYQKKLTTLNNLCGIVAEVENFTKEKLGELRKMDDHLADLIACCLDAEASCRPTAVEILKHPAVTKYTSKFDMDALVRRIKLNA